MPDRPRANRTVSFPAFQTPGGLTAQAVREHNSDYAETQGHAQELTKRTDGVWLPLPYSAGRFAASDPGSVLFVSRGRIQTARYKLMGAQLQLEVAFFGTVSNAPTSALTVQLPERLKIRQFASSVGTGSVPGSYLFTRNQATPGQKRLDIFRHDFTPWGVADVNALASIVIEVEEV